MKLKKKRAQRVSLCFTAVFAAAAVLITAGCNRGNAQAAGAASAAAVPAAQETVYAVNTAVVSAGNLDGYLEFGGDVTSASSVDVLPDTTGKVARLLVKVGDYVQRNQLLAEIDPSRPGMDFALSPVRTPIAGTVTALPFSVGATVAPSVSLAKISTTSNLEIAIEVAERYVSRIRMRQNAQLAFDAYPSEVFAAQVVEIAPALNTTSRTMSVKLNIPENGGRIKIGMYARVKLITDERRNVIVVPYDSLVRRGGEAYVFVKSRNDTTVHLTKVTEGIRVDDRLEITAGLFDGDEIVIKGQTLLNEGSKINVVSRTTIGGEK